MLDREDDKANEDLVIDLSVQYEDQDVNEFVKETDEALKDERTKNVQKNLEVETKISEFYGSEDLFECKNDKPAKAGPLLSTEFGGKAGLGENNEFIVSF